MLLRLFLILGLVLLGGTGWFIVGTQPPTVQGAPVEAMTYRLQESGFLPKGDIEEDEVVEEAEIFEVPPMDEMMLEAAMEAMGDMPGMKMDGDSGSMNMSEGGDTGMKMEGDGNSMTMADGDQPMNMGESSDGAMKMDSGSGSMNMGDGSDTGMKMGMAVECEDGSGLSFCKGAPGEVDREITLSMREWSFDKMDVEVKKGEKIRLTVRNDGQILHEFMFMSMPLMQAVEYRAKRADWSLFEHEALFEQALLVPGQEMTVVI